MDELHIDYNSLSGKTSLLDQTTINSVQSIFNNDIVDLWAEDFLADFIDFFVWSDKISYPLSITNINSDYSDIVLPELLCMLKSHDSSSIVEKVEKYEKIQLSSELLCGTFEKFYDYVFNNKNRIRAFLNLHQKQLIVDQVNSRFKETGGYVFDVTEIKRYYKNFDEKLKIIGLEEKQLFYLFDLVLKYFKYAELVDDESYYFSHPIRENQGFSFSKKQIGKMPKIPLRLGQYIAPIALKSKMEDFAIMLHELRGYVRDMNMIDLAPGSIEKETIRELAQKIKLPPKFKDFPKKITAFSAIISGLGAYPLLGPTSTILGAALCLTTLIWKGQLPKSSGNLKWLQWAIQWDIEQINSDNEK
jgi:hypothetical protein